MLDKCQGYFLVESCEYTSLDLVQAIAVNAFQNGMIVSPSVLQVLLARFKELNISGDPVAMAYMLYSNARCSADKARELGWRPQEKDILQCVQDEVERGSS